MAVELVARAKSKILSEKIETVIPAKQQAALICKMATECFSSHCHLAYISVTTRMRISGFHCAAVAALGLKGCCAAQVGRWSATFREEHVGAHPLRLLELVNCGYCEILTQHRTLCGYHSSFHEIRHFNFSPKIHWALTCIYLSLQIRFDILPHTWLWSLSLSIFTKVGKPLLYTILATGPCYWSCGLGCVSQVVSVLRFLYQFPLGECVSLFVSFVSCQVEVSTTSWSLFQRIPTYCGAFLCVLFKPHAWGGHGTSWAAEPQEKW
jgi:hypothetical protein